MAVWLGRVLAGWASLILLPLRRRIHREAIKSPALVVQASVVVDCEDDSSFRYTLFTGRVRGPRGVTKRNLCTFPESKGPQQGRGHGVWNVGQGLFFGACMLQVRLAPRDIKTRTCYGPEGC